MRLILSLFFIVHPSSSSSSSPASVCSPSHTMGKTEKILSWASSSYASSFLGLANDYVWLFFFLPESFVWVCRRPHCYNPLDLGRCISNYGSRLQSLVTLISILHAHPAIGILSHLVGLIRTSWGLLLGSLSHVAYVGKTHVHPYSRTLAYKQDNYCCSSVSGCYIFSSHELSWAHISHTFHSYLSHYVSSLSRFRTNRVALTPFPGQFFSVFFFFYPFYKNFYILDVNEEIWESCHRFLPISFIKSVYGKLFHTCFIIWC